MAKECELVSQIGKVGPKGKRRHSGEFEASHRCIFDLEKTHMLCIERDILGGVAWVCESLSWRYSRTRRRLTISASDLTRNNPSISLRGDPYTTLHKPTHASCSPVNNTIYTECIYQHPGKFPDSLVSSFLFPSRLAIAEANIQHSAWISSSVIPPRRSLLQGSNLPRIFRGIPILWRIRGKISRILSSPDRAFANLKNRWARSSVS